MNNPWLEFRRWCVSIVVLMILLVVITGLVLTGETLFGAIGAAITIFYIAGHAIRWIITDRTAPPPAIPRAFPLGSSSTPMGGPTHVLPFPAPEPPQPADSPTDAEQAA